MGTEKQVPMEYIQLARRQYAAGLLNRHIAANAERLIDAFAEAAGEPADVTVLCACGSSECDRPTLTLPLDDYRTVLVSPHRFVVAPGHAAEIDDIVYAGSDFEVVEIKPEYRLDEPML